MDYIKFLDTSMKMFMEGAVFYNIFTFHAVGLGVIILFSYTLKESLWVSLRFASFLMIQTIIMLIVYPYFNFPSRDVFILLFLIGTELIVSVLMDFLFPQSVLENGVRGFTKRGDAILPMVLATIIAQNHDPSKVLPYALGVGFGFAMILIGMTAISMKFSFHRFSNSKVYIYKFFILGILAMIFY
ncbi:MAG: hypothetical protein ACRCV0_06230 [Brevinema sp.]